MILKIGENIITSLGFTAKENYRKVKEGQCGLRHHDHGEYLKEDYFASIIDRSLLSERFEEIRGDGTEYTPLEKAAILSISDALSQSGIDAGSEDTIFILSTTKGNVHLLDSRLSGTFSPERLHLWKSAKLISEFFHNPNTPLVISNACISGASAQIAAKRELESGRYRYAVVTGADLLSPFVISGFQSFKALSPTLCKPFDAGRIGLNLGEAAATIVYGCEDAVNSKPGDIVLLEGAIRNDANHISGPSRTGEGSYLALREIMKGRDADEISFVNTHGTSTPYNDEMESIALTRAGLASRPANSLKGVFGHTLGAAGVLETIISAHALCDGIVLKTNGFETLGVTHPLHITTSNIEGQGECFIKMLSGFGGCNAALLFSRKY